MTVIHAIVAGYRGDAHNSASTLGLTGQHPAFTAFLEEAHGLFSPEIPQHIAAAYKKPSANESLLPVTARFAVTSASFANEFTGHTVAASGERNTGRGEKTHT
ncbi:MAG: hypothetical protein B7X02_00020 [Rhodospirillales bacterium 12-54-5]|nr:MAG: hypothetical protein B7X02_00020 [Rhodospirillales bacterium 12-54-5]